MNEPALVDDITHLSTIDQYLTFSVGVEDYGVHILCVQEIRGWEPVAMVPNTPRHVKGVLNLRGTAVPVVDMRIRFGKQDPEYNETTVVIILRAEIDGQERIAGIVVDDVSDVMNARSDAVKKTPDFGNRVDTEFIKGLVDADGRMVMLFDVDTFMHHPDIYAADDNPE